MREAEMEFSMETFQQLMVFVKSLPWVKKIKIAVIVDSASKIVYPMMASNDKDLNIQPFSTFESARDWLLQ